GPWMDFIKFVFGTTMVGMALYYVMPVYPAWLSHALLGLALILIAGAFGAFEANEHLNSTARVRKAVMLATFVVGLAFMLVGVLSKANVPISLGQGGSAAPGNGGPTMAAATAPDKLAWQPYSESAVQAALTAKKPVLIDFHAEWCAACTELET